MAKTMTEAETKAEAENAKWALVDVIVRTCVTGY
jgi:hypothetical protein